MKAERRTSPGLTLTPQQFSFRKLADPLFIGVGLVLLFATYFAYSDHFNNPFHFDDDHTIVTNDWVRRLDSFPKFFSDSTTSSSLPRNRAYRPGVTLLHAIDYRLGLDTTSEEARDSLAKAKTPAERQMILNGFLEPKTKPFHVHIFTGFILSGFLLFFVLLHLFNRAGPNGKWNHWMALLGMGWFWLHTANAETINYISARSDSASTFWILLAFVMYFYSNVSRKFFLYLIPVICGFFIKEPAIMFAPLLLVYILLFEEKNAMRKSSNRFAVGISFLAAVILFLFSRTHTPTTWNAGGTDPWNYLLTETFVIFHYFISFFLPVNLSADTDWAPVTRVFDDKVLAGTLFIGVLVYIIIRCWSKPKWRLVSFGLIWFFIALAPTSSIFPFAEVLNDHRTYFPYIGLIIATVWTLGTWLQDLQEKKYDVKTVAIAGASLVLLLNGAGTYVRSHVWSSGFTLWGDCVKKSPGNGRAWMHYGMSLFAKGNEARQRRHEDSIKFWYDSAEVCYKRAESLLPYYSYLQINYGVLRQWQGRMNEAETKYRNALAFDPGNPEAYFFLGDFLRLTGKTDEAYEKATAGLALSANNKRLLALVSQLSPGNPYKDVAMYENKVKQQPAVNDYINLSLAYYNIHEYEKCIEASNGALKLDSTNVAALNNICTSFNMLGRYDEAIIAGSRAMRINPNFAQARGNLGEALRLKHIQDSLEAKLPPKPTVDDYINLSLAYYNAGMYARTVSAAQRAADLQPNNAAAWNNICTAYNKLYRYDLAVQAGQKAFSLAADPSHPLHALAQGNLNEAQSGLQRVELMKQSANK